MLVISEAEVERLLDLGELTQAMERALIAFSAGEVVQPVRTILHIEQARGIFALMPALYGGVMGAKLVTVFPSNASRGVHTHNAVIQLFTAHTGEPLAVLDGRVITAWRTAAVSALATRELSDVNARVLAILGSGVQARTHYKALRMVRDFEEVRIWSRTPEHAELFADETGARVMSARDAVEGADVIVTVTNSPTPILNGEWVKAGTHINAVGSVGAKFREIDDDVMKRAAVIVESRESALREAGEIIQSGAEIYAELGEILSGSRRKPTAEISVYKSLGIAVEDVAAAKLVSDKWLTISDAARSKEPG